LTAENREFVEQQLIDSSTMVESATDALVNGVAISFSFSVKISGSSNPTEYYSAFNSAFASFSQIYKEVSEARGLCFVRSRGVA
jgi:hypothetical protein